MKKIPAGNILRILLTILIPVLAFFVTVTVIKVVQKNQAGEEASSEAKVPGSSEILPADESSAEASSDTASSGDTDSSEEISAGDTGSDRSGYDKEISEESNSGAEGESSEEASGEDASDGETDPESTESSVSATPYLLRVNCATNVITVYTYDDNGEYTIPIRAMICSTGPATPQGSYTMGYQARWNELIEDQWGQYVSHITGDFLFHTVPSQTKSESTVSVSDYNQLGTSCSHGCVRVTAGDAYWIYCNCTAYETLIEIGYYDSDPLGKPAAIKLPTTSATNWDPTDPSPDNPWNDKTPTFTGVPTSITLTQGTETPNLSYGVVAYDTCGNPQSYFSVSTDLDVNTPGTYTVTYSFTDVLGRTGMASTEITVTEPDPEESSGESGSQDSESQEPGSQESGSQDSDSQESGSQESGSQESQSQESGSQESQSQESRGSLPEESGSGSSGSEDSVSSSPE